MVIDACFKIGFIQKTHGLKGEITISLDPEAPDELGHLESLFLEQDQRLVPFFIKSISVQGAKAIVNFEDVDTLESAQKLVKRSVYLPKSLRPKTGRGEFYDDEIIDFNVVDAGLGALGSVTDVMKAGPNRLLVVDHQGKEILIPINSPFITSINKTKKTVSVTLPEGFLDI